MSIRIPTILPGVLIRPIDTNYFYSVNCTKPESLRIINAAQRVFLNSVNGASSLTEIADHHAISAETAHKLYLSFIQSGILQAGESIDWTSKPKSPTALDFWIHTTNACNLGCSYCYIPTLHSSGGMSEEVRTQLLEKLVETVVRKRIRKIRLRLAGGEPLTQFRAWKTFIPHAREALAINSCELEIAFITNLTLLSNEVIEFAKAQRIGFGVSMDGLGEDHDRARHFLSGRGSFATIQKNIHRLIESGLDVSTTTVVTNENLSGLPALTEYLINLDIPFRFSIVKGDEIDAIKLERSLGICFEIMQEAVRNGWSAVRRFQLNDLKPTTLGFQTCSSGFSGGAINVDGSLAYCQVKLGSAEEVDRSIYEKDLDLVDMIEYGPHFEDERSDDCKACPYRSVCTSGCPVYRIDKKDPQCSIYHRFIPRLYDLHALERLRLLQLHGIIPSVP